MSDNLMFAILTSLGAPILVFLGGIISWFLKTRSEELKAIEEKAQERRVETYNKLLNPMIVLLTKTSSDKMKAKAEAEISSVDYRRAGFDLIIFGSDEMVNEYNELMQGLYKGKTETEPKVVMKQFAKFILSIRKDVYNKHTKLEEWDMLKFMITDIEKLTT